MYTRKHVDTAAYTTHTHKAHPDVVSLTTMLMVITENYHEVTRTAMLPMATA